MKLFSAAALTVALAAGGAHALETKQDIQCLGRVAHRTRVEVDTDGKPVSIFVDSLPEENVRCHEVGATRGVGGNHPICIGINEDTSCQKAKDSSLPLPAGARCEGCFLGLTTDLFYSLNITRLRLQHAGIGFRGTQLRTTIEVEEDKGAASRVRHGSKTFLSKPLEWKLHLFGKTLLDFRLSMPVEVHYHFESRGGAHADSGAMLDVNLGETSVTYQRGEGWHVQRDKPQLVLKPIVEGDYNGQASLSVGVNSSFKYEVVDLLWFRSDFTADVPMELSSAGSTKAHHVQTCANGGLSYSLQHEADAKLVLFHKTTAHHHWGPRASHRNYSNPSRFHRCVDWRRPHPSASSSASAFELVV